MPYLIETTIGDFKYWVKITYEGARYHSFRMEGLKDDGTKFSTKEKADEAVSRLKAKTPLIVVNNNQ